MTNGTIAADRVVTDETAAEHLVRTQPTFNGLHVEPLTFVAHFHIDTFVPHAEGEADLFGSIAPVAVHYRVLHRLKRCHRHRRVAIAQVALVAKAKQPLLHQRKIGDIRLYIKCFRHRADNWFPAQIYIIFQNPPPNHFSLPREWTAAPPLPTPIISPCGAFCMVKPPCTRIAPETLSSGRKNSPSARPCPHARRDHLDRQARWALPHPRLNLPHPASATA